MLFRIFLLGLATVCAPLHAQEAVPTEAATPSSSAVKSPQQLSELLSASTPRTQAERDDMAARGQLLNEESRTRKEAAEKTLEAAKTECWKKFLVSACLDDSRTAYRKEVSLAKRQEREAQALDRNVRKYDAMIKAQERDEENAKRDEENARRAAEYRAKQAEKDKKRGTAAAP